MLTNESRRQKQVSNLLKAELSQIFIKDGRNFYGNAFVTIVDVLVSVDLYICKVFVSVMGTDEKEVVIDKLNQNTNEIRRAVGNQLRHNLRVIPKIEFYIDETLDNVFRIQELLDGDDN